MKALRSAGLASATSSADPEGRRLAFAATEATDFDVKLLGEVQEEAPAGLFANRAFATSEPDQAR